MTKMVFRSIFLRGDYLARKTGILDIATASNLRPIILNTRLQQNVITDYGRQHGKITDGFLHIDY